MPITQSEQLNLLKVLYNPFSSSVERKICILKLLETKPFSDLLFDISLVRDKEPGFLVPDSEGPKISLFTLLYGSKLLSLSRVNLDICEDILKIFVLAIKNNEIIDEQSSTCFVLEINKQTFEIPQVHLTINLGETLTALFQYDPKQFELCLNSILSLLNSVDPEYSTNQIQIILKDVIYAKNIELFSYLLEHEAFQCIKNEVRTLTNILQFEEPHAKACLIYLFLLAMYPPLKVDREINASTETLPEISFLFNTGASQSHEALQKLTDRIVEEITIDYPNLAWGVWKKNIPEIQNSIGKLGHFKDVLALLIKKIADKKYFNTANFFIAKFDYFTACISNHDLHLISYAIAKKDYKKALEITQQCKNSERNILQCMISISQNTSVSDNHYQYLEGLTEKELNQAIFKKVLNDFDFTIFPIAISHIKSLYKLLIQRSFAVNSIKAAQYFIERYRALEGNALENIVDIYLLVENIKLPKNIFKLVGFLEKYYSHADILKACIAKIKKTSEWDTIEKITQYLLECNENNLNLSVLLCDLIAKENTIAPFINEKRPLKILVINHLLTSSDHLDFVISLILSDHTDPKIAISSLIVFLFNSEEKYPDLKSRLLAILHCLVSMKKCLVDPQDFFDTFFDAQKNPDSPLLALQTAYALQNMEHGKKYLKPALYIKFYEFLLNNDKVPAHHTKWILETLQNDIPLLENFIKHIRDEIKVTNDSEAMIKIQALIISTTHLLDTESTKLLSLYQYALTTFAHSNDFCKNLIDKIDQFLARVCVDPSCNTAIFEEGIKAIKESKPNHAIIYAWIRCIVLGDEMKLTQLMTSCKSNDFDDILKCEEALAILFEKLKESDDKLRKTFISNLPHEIRSKPIWNIYLTQAIKPDMKKQVLIQEVVKVQKKETDKKIAAKPKQKTKLNSTHSENKTKDSSQRQSQQSTVVITKKMTKKEVVVAKNVGPIRIIPSETKKQIDIPEFKGEKPRLIDVLLNRQTSIPSKNHGPLNEDVNTIPNTAEELKNQWKDKARAQDVNTQNISSLAFFDMLEIILRGNKDFLLNRCLEHMQLCMQNNPANAYHLANWLVNESTIQPIFLVKFIKDFITNNQPQLKSISTPAELSIEQTNLEEYLNYLLKLVEGKIKVIPNDVSLNQSLIVQCDIPQLLSLPIPNVHYTAYLHLCALVETVPSLATIEYLLYIKSLPYLSLVHTPFQYNSLYCADATLLLEALIDRAVNLYFPSIQILFQEINKKGNVLQLLDCYANTLHPLFALSALYELLSDIHARQNLIDVEDKTLIAAKEVVLTVIANQMQKLLPPNLLPAELRSYLEKNLLINHSLKPYLIQLSVYWYLRQSIETNVSSQDDKKALIQVIEEFSVQLYDVIFPIDLLLKNLITDMELRDESENYNFIDMHHNAYALLYAIAFKMDRNAALLLLEHTSQKIEKKLTATTTIKEIKALDKFQMAVKHTKEIIEDAVLSRTEPTPINFKYSQKQTLLGTTPYVNVATQSSLQDIQSEDKSRNTQFIR